MSGFGIIMANFACASCSISFDSKNLRDAHSKRCVKTATITNGKGNRVTITRDDNGTFRCYCSHVACPKTKGYATSNALQKHITKSQTTWLGPEGKKAASSSRSTSTNHVQHSDNTKGASQSTRPVDEPRRSVQLMIDEDVDMSPPVPTTPTIPQQTIPITEHGSSTMHAVDNEASRVRLTWLVDEPCMTASLLQVASVDEASRVRLA